jgi:hypothetical protein
MVRRHFGSEDPQSPKKRRERRALDAVRALMPALPQGEARDGEAGQEPDFVIQCASGSFGIEVVEYFQPDIHSGLPVRAQEAFLEAVSKAAMTECGHAGLIHVSATVTFDLDLRINKAQVVDVAKCIVDLIRPASSATVPSLRLRNREDLPRGIREIWAHYRPWVEEPFVGISWGGTVPPVDEKTLHELIAEKETKLEQIYRHRCSEVLLIVLVDPYRGPSMAYVPPESRLVTSTFSRVVALQGWSEIVELWNAAITRDGHSR